MFAGAVDLDAVEQVCADDEALPEDEVVDALAALVAGSVVLLEPRDDGVGYRLLRSVRQYGAERLEQAGEPTRCATGTRSGRRRGERWLRRADLEPPPGPLLELAAAQDDVLVGLARLGPREPERVLGCCCRCAATCASRSTSRTCSRSPSGCPRRRGTGPSSPLLRAQLSWERSPGPDTVRCSPRPRTPPRRVAGIAWTCCAGGHGARAVRARPRPGREEALERAAAQSGDPGLRVRATAMRAHADVARGRRCLTGPSSSRARRRRGCWRGRPAGGCTCGG